MDKTSFNVKFFDWDYLHLTAQTKETYFRVIFSAPNDFMHLFYKMYQLKIKEIKMEVPFLYMKFWTNQYKDKISPKSLYKK